MHFLEKFCNNVLKRDLINKFIYKNTKHVPVIKKIILNFGCKPSDIKQLGSSLLALELITGKRGQFTKTRYSNILLKIRKGNPTGCKVTLIKSQQLIFLELLIVEILPKFKNFKGFTVPSKLNKNVFSFTLSETFDFDELEKHYYLFNTLPELHVTIVTNTKTQQELFFLLHSVQLPFKR